MRIRLTIFLFSSSIKTLDQAVDVSDLESFTEHEPSDAGLDYPARCFTNATQSSAPSWLEFYQSGFRIRDADLETRSASLVLLIQASSRVFAVTAGAGFHRVPKDLIERDFGLRTTLNAVGPDTLRSLQSRTVDPLTVQKLAVANRNTTLQTLDLDRFRELLAKLEGKPVDQHLGVAMSGSDSLSLTTEVDVAGLATKCTELLNLSRKRTYRKHFGFVDQMRPERDATVIAKLDDCLRKELREPGEANISLSLPSIDRYADIDSYVLRHGRRDLADLEDLRTEIFLAGLDKLHEDADLLGDVRIIGLDETGERVIGTALCDWLVAEMKLERKTYIFTAGSWYEISETFVREINDRLAAAGLIRKTGYLPNIRRIDGKPESEGDYNLRCATASRLCLDQQNITMERYGPVEPCDLFTNKRHIIHVKKQTSSATLSHLWGQGLVGSQLLVESRDFRRKLRAKLGTLRDLVPLDEIKPSEFTVVYAIASEADPFPGRLPFFSKVNFLHHHRELERMGFRVRLYQIRYT